MCIYKFYNLKGFILGGNTPIAVASSPIVTVSEGGQFTITATASSAPNGDDLSFTWVQTAGPNVLPGGTIQTPNLTLSAPAVTQDTALTFELTASDGTNSSTDIVTVTTEPIAMPLTVRPVSPINTDTAIIFGITNEGADQYRIYWEDNIFGSRDIASQLFSDTGTPIGPQTNAFFDLPQSGSDARIAFIDLQPISIIENGGTTHMQLYSFDFVLPFFFNLIGPFEGNLSPVNISFTGAVMPFFFDQTPIGQDEVINVIAENSGLPGSIVIVNRLGADGDVQNPDFAFIDPLDFTISPSTGPRPSFVSDPSVTGIGEGGFIVAWRREDGQFPPQLSIEAQIYTSDNALSGQNITLDANTTVGNNFNAEELDAATLGNGDALIFWIESQGTDANGDLNDFTIQGRVVSSDGTFASSEFSVSESVSDQVAISALSLSNGDVLVVWRESDDTLKARKISSNGDLTTQGNIFDLATNVDTDAFNVLQTETGRVIIGYDQEIGNSSVTTEIISFCPVGCQ